MSAPRPRAGGGVVAGLLVLRLFAAAFFLDTALYKLVDYPASQGFGALERFERFRADEYEPLVRAAIERPPTAFGVEMTWFARFLEHVMLPGSAVFSPMVLVGEALLGVSLLLGLAVRLSAGLGFLMMLAFSMAKFVPSGDGGAAHPYVLTVHSANWPVTAILLALALAAAGRHAGLDAWLRPRLPRGLRWVA